MNNKYFDAILCIVSTFLWFMPFHSMENMGAYSPNHFQAGNHIGGVAYMALFYQFYTFVFHGTKI